MGYGWCTSNPFWWRGGSGGGGGASYSYGSPGTRTLESNVVAQWLCNEPSGSLVDVVNGITLAVSGAPTFNVTDLTGSYAYLDPGVNYAGTTYHTAAAAAAMDFGVSDGVIECWAKYNGGSNRPPFADNENSGDERGWAIQWSNATTLRIAFCADDKTFTQGTATVPDKTGTAVKLRYTVDRSGNAEIFMDGVSYGTVNISACNGKATSSYAPTIGGAKAGTTKFNGTVYEARLTVGNLTNDSGDPTGPNDPYEYGSPTFLEPDVAMQWLYNESASPLTEVVEGFTAETSGTPAFNQVATGGWANLSPGINFYSGRARDYTTATPAGYAIGTSDFTLEAVIKLDSRTSVPQTNHSAFSFVRHDDDRGYAMLFNRRNPSSLYVQVYIKTEDSTLLLASHYIDVSGDPWTDDAIHKYRWVGDRSGNSELFVDGVSQGTAVLSSLDGKTIPAKSVNAAGGAVTTTFGGTLYEVRVSKNLTNNSDGPGGG